MSARQARQERAVGLWVVARIRLARARELRAGLGSEEVGGRKVLVGKRIDVSERIELSGSFRRFQRH